MKQHRVFILTGEQGSGKTTRLQEILNIFRKEDLPFFGFYALGYWENGIRSKFDLTDIISGEKFLLCQRKTDGKTKNGTFVFYPETIRKGESLLRYGMKNPDNLAVIDEVGPFELKGKVWDTILWELIKKQQPLLLTVREKLLKEITEHYNLKKVWIYPVRQPASVTAKDILQHLR